MVNIDFRKQGPHAKERLLATNDEETRQMKYKVLLLYPYYWPHYRAGGPVQSLYNLVSYFRYDADFYLVSHDHDIDGQFPDQPLTLNKWVKGPQDEHIYYTRSISLGLLYRLIKEVGPDRVLINGLFYFDTSLMGLLASRLTGRRICISPRGMLQDWALSRRSVKKKYYLLLFKMLMGKSVVWHATDDREREDIHRKFGRQQQVNVALNIPRRVSQGSLLDFPGRNERIKIVFLSLINPNKNLHLVIDEVKKFPELFSLDIYGPVMDEAYWETCQQSIGASPAINYHGAVSAWEVPDILREYHFFVLPTKGENFGHAIFDSLASGVPVLIPRTTPWLDLDQYNAGIYFDLDGGFTLGAALQGISRLNAEDYGAMRTSSLAYANRYTAARDFKREYEFLIPSDGTEKT